MQALAVNAAQVAAQAATRPVRGARRAARRVVVRAEKEVSPTASVDLVDENVIEYCSLDANGKRPTKALTLGEKEQLFLEAMAAYYYDESPVLSNEEFDLLKEELTWEGSKVVVLTTDEKKFLEARLAFKAGKPIMNNEEYDALKERLSGSSVFVLPREGPACTIGKPGVRGQKVGEAQKDWIKMAALAIPPPLVIATVVIGADLLTGANLMHLPGKVGAVVWGALVLPTVYVAANAVSNLLFKDALVLKAPCPNCGEVNTTYFGDILTVPGNRDKNDVKCPCCQSVLTFDAKEREVVVSEPAPSA